MISIALAINYQHQLEKHSSDIICGRVVSVLLFVTQNDHLPYAEERLGTVTIFTLSGTVHRKLRATMAFYCQWFLCNYDM